MGDDCPHRPILVQQSLGADEGLADGEQALASKRQVHGLSIGKEEAIQGPVPQAFSQGLYDKHDKIRAF